MNNIQLNIIANAQFQQVYAEVARLKEAMASLQKMSVGGPFAPGIATDIKAAQSAFDSAILSTRAFTMQHVAMTDSVTKFGKQLEAGKLSLNNYYKIWRDSAKGVSAELDALATSQARLNRSIAIADPLRPGYAKLVTDINGLVTAQEKTIFYQKALNTALHDGSMKLINFGKNTQWAGRQITVGLTMPLTILGGILSATFLQVDKELVRMQKVYGTGVIQPTTKALKDIRAQVEALGKDLSHTLGTSMKDTATVAADLAATGLEGAKLIGATREAVRLSVLGELDYQQAVKTTISLQNVYKLSTSGLAQAVNFLNAVENQTSTSLQDLVDAIPRVGPIVQQLGGSFKDTAAMMVAMKEAGVPAAQGANAIKSALSSLINPTKNAQAAFKSYNIDLMAISQKTGGAPMAMLKMLADQMKNLNKLAQAQLIEKLFGKFQFARIQALIDNINRAGSQTATVFNLMTASTLDLASLAENEIKQQTQSASGKFKIMVESMKTDLLPMGKAFLESFTRIGNAVLNVVHAVKRLADFLGPVAGILGKVLGTGLVSVVIVGPLLMIIGIFANLGGNILKAANYMRMFRQGMDQAGPSQNRFLAGLQNMRNFYQNLDAGIIAARNQMELMPAAITSNAKAFEILNASIRTLTVQFEALAVAQRAASFGGVAALFGPSAPDAAKFLKIVPKNKGGALPGYEGGGDVSMVPGPTHITYDSVLGTVPLGGYVLNKTASTKLLQGYNSGGSIKAMLTPGELIFSPEVTKRNKPTLEALNNGYSIGGMVHSNKRGYGIWSSLAPMFATAFMDPIAARAMVAKLFETKAGKQLLAEGSIAIPGIPNTASKLKEMVSRLQTEKAIVSEIAQNPAMRPYVKDFNYSMYRLSGKLNQTTKSSYEAVADKILQIPGKATGVDYLRQFTSSKEVFSTINELYPGLINSQKQREIIKTLSNIVPKTKQLTEEEFGLYLSKALKENGIPKSVFDKLNESAGFRIEFPRMDSQGIIRPYQAGGPERKAKAMIDILKKEYPDALYEAKVKGGKASIAVTANGKTFNIYDGRSVYTGYKYGSAGKGLELSHLPVTWDAPLPYNKGGFIQRFGLGGPVAALEASIIERLIAKWSKNAPVWNEDPLHGPLTIGKATDMISSRSPYHSAETLARFKYGLPRKINYPGMAFSRQYPLGSDIEQAKYVLNQYMQGYDAEFMSSPAVKRGLATMAEKYTGTAYRGFRMNRKKVAEGIPNSIAAAIYDAQMSGNFANLVGKKFIMRSSSWSSSPEVASRFADLGKYHMPDLTGTTFEVQLSNKNVVNASKIFPELKFDETGRFLGSNTENELLFGGAFEIVNAVPGKITLRTAAGIPGRANGGDVTRGKPYIVGEKGPELFMPGRNGSVLSNYALGGLIRRGKSGYGDMNKVLKQRDIAAAGGKPGVSFVSYEGTTYAPGNLVNDPRLGYNLPGQGGFNRLADKMESPYNPFTKENLNNIKINTKQSFQDLTNSMRNSARIDPKIISNSFSESMGKVTTSFSSIASKMPTMRRFAGFAAMPALFASQYLPNQVGGRDITVEKEVGSQAIINTMFAGMIKKSERFGRFYKPVMIAVAAFEAFQYYTKKNAQALQKDMDAVNAKYDKLKSAPEKYIEAILGEVEANNKAKKSYEELSARGKLYASGLYNIVAGIQDGYIRGQQMQSVLSTISTKTKDTVLQFNLLRDAAVNAKDVDMTNLLDSLGKVYGQTKQSFDMLVRFSQIQSVGGSSKDFISQFGITGIADPNKAIAYLESLKKSASAQNQQYGAQTGQVNALDTKIKKEETVLKTLETQLKTMQDQANVLDKQNAYYNEQQRLLQSAKQAQASGDYIGAAIIRQEQMQSTAKYRQQQAIDAKQAQVDAEKAKIDDMRAQQQQLKDIASNTATTANNTGLSVNAINNLESEIKSHWVLDPASSGFSMVPAEGTSRYNPKSLGDFRTMAGKSGVRKMLTVNNLGAEWNSKAGGLLGNVANFVSAGTLGEMNVRKQVEEIAKNQGIAKESYFSLSDNTGKSYTFYYQKDGSVMMVDNYGKGGKSGSGKASSNFTTTTFGSSTTSTSSPSKYGGITLPSLSSTSTSTKSYSTSGVKTGSTYPSPSNTSSASSTAQTPTIGNQTNNFYLTGDPKQNAQEIARILAKQNAKTNKTNMVGANK